MALVEHNLPIELIPYDLKKKTLIKNYIKEHPENFEKLMITPDKVKEIIESFKKIVADNTPARLAGAPLLLDIKKNVIRTFTDKINEELSTKFGLTRFTDPIANADADADAAADAAAAAAAATDVFNTATNNFSNAANNNGAPAITIVFYKLNTLYTAAVNVTAALLDENIIITTFKTNVAVINTDNTTHGLIDILNTRIDAMVEDDVASGVYQLYDYITKFDNVEYFEFDVGVKYIPKNDAKESKTYFDMYSDSDDTRVKGNLDSIKKITSVYKPKNAFAINGNVRITDVIIKIPLNYNETLDWLNRNTKTEIRLRGTDKFVSKDGPISVAPGLTGGGATKKKRNRKRGKTQRRK